MRTLKFLLQKEFKQIFRDKAILGIILAMPVIQLLILPLAADFEVKNVNLAVVDNDHSTYSQQLVSTVIASGYFKLIDYNQSYRQSLELIESDKADLILEIPVDFERNLVRESNQQVFIAVNAINGTKANLGASYLNNIIRNYNQTLRTKLIQTTLPGTQGGQVSMQGIQGGSQEVQVDAPGITVGAQGEQVGTQGIAVGTQGEQVGMQGIPVSKQGVQVDKGTNAGIRTGTQISSQDLQETTMGAQENTQGAVIEITSSNWFNPGMNYQSFMVPGILAFLVTMVVGFMSALNIVKEKEIGTIEQINVTPIKKYLFILGKLIPFWIMGNVVFTLGLLIIRVIYGIVPEGSIFVLYCFIWVYLLAVLGFGLLVSTYSETQQQSMFIMFFFIMIFILLGGLFTSIDSMPGWAKVIARINPVSHIVEVFRMVILKGSSLRDILPHIGIISVLAVILNTWAVFNYKKTV
ncbi:MAG: ABC transporter permease [Lentimicrobiaceae bacterium]